jgi:hypothetical protein
LVAAAVTIHAENVRLIAKALAASTSAAADLTAANTASNAATAAPPADAAGVAAVALRRDESDAVIAELEVAAAAATKDANAALKTSSDAADAWRQSVVHQGGPVLADPIKPTLNAPGTERMILKYDVTLSNVAFKLTCATTSR